MSFRRHSRLILLGLVVSILAVIFVGKELDLESVTEALSAARFGYIVPCILLLMGGLVFRALRWRILLGGALPLSRTFHIMNVAYLVNGVLPLRIGELARAFLAWRGRPSVPLMTTAGTVIVERLLDLLAVVLMVAYALAVGPVPDELRSAGILFGTIGAVGFLVVVFFSYQRNLAHRILGLTIGWAGNLSRWDFKTLLDHFLDGILPLASWRKLLMALLWTGISWAWSIAAGYVLMYAFYDTPSLAATTLYIAAAALAIAVPATVGNIGVYEASIMLALAAFSYGNSADIAFAFAVTVHAVNVFVHTLTGIVGFVMEGVSWEQLTVGVQGISGAMDDDAVTTDLNHLTAREVID